MRISSSVPRSLLLASAFIGMLTLRCGRADGQPPGRGARRRPGASAGFAADRPARQRRGAKAGAGCGSAARGRARQAADWTKLKVPAGFNLEVYAAGMPNARSLALGDKGTVFVGSRTRRQGLCHRQQGRQARGQDLASGLYRPNGVAFQNGTLYIAELSKISQDREDRGQSRQSAEADRDLRQPAEGRSPRLEVHRHRTRQQALCSGRPARQQRAA